MKVRQSIVNPNKNSIMMFTEKLPYENVERSSDLQMHRKPYMSSAQSCTLDRQRNTPKKLVWTRMCTGSSYYGHWNQFGFNGHGIYRFPDGLTYDGELKDGHFHGEGTLTFPDGNVIMGHWEMGINTYMNLRFVDGLEFKETDWDYCMSPDRRYSWLLHMWPLVVLTTYCLGSPWTSSMHWPRLATTPSIRNTTMPTTFLPATTTPARVSTIRSLTVFTNGTIRHRSCVFRPTLRWIGF